MKTNWRKDVAIAYGDEGTESAIILAEISAVKRTRYDPEVGWGQTGRWDIPDSWVTRRESGATFFTTPDGRNFCTHPGDTHSRGRTFATQK